MKLTNNIKQIIESIKFISKEILEIYEKLQELEEKGLTCEEKFKNLLTSLKNDINITNNLYLSLGNNVSELQEILHYLNCYKVLKNIDEDLDLILDKKDDLVNYRIIKNIARIFLSNPQVKLKNIYVPYDVADTCNSDIINTLLNLINEYLNDEKVASDFKKYLRKIKYHLIYINPIFEKDLVEHDFNINPKIVWNTRAACNISDIDERIGIVQRQVIISPLYSKSLDYIYNNCTNINDNKNYFEFMIILFRCSLLFFDQDVVKKSLENFYKMSLENFSGIEGVAYEILIKDASSHLDDDRSKIEDVSFRR